ncbi:MAG: nucleoside hydrolase, partial [Pseudomonadota bacterium]
MRQQIIIDCDPGQDDAINLLLAMVHPTVFDVLGITTVAGNVPLSLTQRNARLMCDLAGRHDIPVFAGCDKPMHRPLTTAEHVHGDTGIDGMDVTEPSSPLASRHAVQFITETLMSAEDESITLVPTGPLTNIGQVLTQAPELTQKIRSIVLMGGAFREGGNYTPSAEFNILVDPEAAATVFSCGRPIVAMGLDVTHQVLATEARVASIREVATKPAVATADMLSFFNRYDSRKYGSDGAPLHDPCTIAY